MIIVSSNLEGVGNQSIPEVTRKFCFEVRKDDIFSAASRTPPWPASPRRPCALGKRDPHIPILTMLAAIQEFFKGARGQVLPLATSAVLALQMERTSPHRSAVSESCLVASPRSDARCQQPSLLLPYPRTRNPSSRLLEHTSCSRSNSPCVPAAGRLRDSGA